MHKTAIPVWMKPGGHIVQFPRAYRCHSDPVLETLGMWQTTTREDLLYCAASITEHHDICTCHPVQVLDCLQHPISNGIVPCLAMNQVCITMDDSWHNGVGSHGVWFQVTSVVIWGTLMSQCYVSDILCPHVSPLLKQHPCAVFQHDMQFHLIFNTPSGSFSLFKPSWKICYISSGHFDCWSWFCFYK